MPNLSRSSLRTGGLFAALVSVSAALTPSGASAQIDIDRAVAVLGALDKITGRVSDLAVPVGEGASFESLDVTVRACRVPPPDRPPEAAAFLEIDDTPPGRGTERVFSGWMFASSPAVSAMEHPVYDVWVVRCADALPIDIVDPSLPPPGSFSLPDAPPLPPRRP